ncbi:MAG: hypothetical protein R2856_08985 [Caldilineaceae bacterium]
MAASTTTVRARGELEPDVVRHGNAEEREEEIQIAHHRHLVVVDGGEVV